MDRKTLKRIVILITAAATLLAAILVVTLIGYVVSITSQQRKNEMLRVELARLIDTRDGLDAEIEYRLSDDFTVRYARESLGLVKPGEHKITP